MSKWHNPEDSLRLPFEPCVIIGQNNTARAAVFCGVVDGVVVHGDDMGRAQLAICIWITWWVDRVKAQEKQVVEFDQFVDVMLNSPRIMVAVRQLHAVWFEGIRPGVW